VESKQLFQTYNIDYHPGVCQGNTVSAESVNFYFNFHCSMGFSVASGSFGHFIKYFERKTIESRTCLLVQWECEDGDNGGVMWCYGRSEWTLVGVNELGATDTECIWQLLFLTCPIITPPPLPPSPLGNGIPIRFRSSLLMCIHSQCGLDLTPQLFSNQSRCLLTHFYWQDLTD